MRKPQIVSVFIATLLVLSCTPSGKVGLGGAGIVYDEKDSETVKIAAGLLGSDIESVTGIAAGSSSLKIYAGTIGSSRVIDSLVDAGLVKVSEIRGDRERYIIDFLKDGNIVVAGSDRRGTAYGMFHISETIGVDPFYWWADVPVAKDAEAALVKARTVSKEPSVRYRGLFINDEDWGLKPWSSENYEKELGDIGPRTYEKVCELILRLGGNMLAPAMHSCTGAFYSHPESKVVADRYGVMITTSHCEPLLFNNAAKSEWDPSRDGEWNYRTNKETIKGKFEARLREAGMYENIYTVAMRGVHDQGLRGDFSKEEKVSVLSDVISDQRQMLAEIVGEDVESIPQIFVPYKETLDIYNLGLEVPEDITLVWPDDNYGYLKRISNPEEQKRSGASGVYYHVSYLGAPHDYLWVSTTPPVLMYEELMKAYRNGADRYWLLNVGDIKPSELSMKTFFDLAMDVDKYDMKSINRHQAGYLAGIYGQEYEDRIQEILDEYYRLAWSRKPEFMGWEREWDRRDLADIMDTEYSFENYSEAQRRLRDYQAVYDKTVEVITSLPLEYRESFYELVAYPVLATTVTNRKFLYAQLNHELYRKGDYAAANWAAEQSQTANRWLNDLTHAYNNMLDGKWNGMMMQAPGYCAAYQNMPRLDITPDVEPVGVDLSVKDEELQGCAVLDITRSGKVIEGMGYDWKVVEVDNLKYELPEIDADEVTVHVWVVPFWPEYEGKSNRINISLDNGGKVLLENKFAEYDVSWKDQVLRNGHEFVVKFPLKGKGPHVLRLEAVDEGQMVQKIVLDWGGLKPSYLGPVLE